MKFALPLIALLFVGCAHAPVPVKETAEPINEKWLEENAATHNHDVLNCYQQRLKAKPKLEGELHLEFLVTSTGGMSDLKITKSLDSEVDRCVVKEAKAWKFPWNIRKGVKEDVAIGDKFKLYFEGGQPRSEFEEAQQKVDKDDIRTVVKSHIEEIRACYAPRVEKNPTLEGKVVLQWDIDETGSVKAPTVLKSVDTDLDNCLIERLKQWKFAIPPKNMVGRVSYPFVFTSK